MAFPSLLQLSCGTMDFVTNTLILDIHSADNLEEQIRLVRDVVTFQQWHYVCADLQHAEYR